MAFSVHVIPFMHCVGLKFLVLTYGNHMALTMHYLKVASYISP